MEEEGEAGSLRERVDVSQGEGAYENANMKEDEKASRKGLVFQEGSNFEQQGASGEKPMEPEGSISQNPLENMDANVENTPMLAPEKLQPENSREILLPNNETKYLKENFLDHESIPYDTVNRQESIDCQSLESDDYSESAPTDNASEMSTSVKIYSTVDDEGTTPQIDEKKEILGKESEDAVMEIAERLSQLRSIGKSEDSARKYLLESDTGMEELDSTDQMSPLLGPKRLDFEVIDFDQFGAQPPDLPLNNTLTKVNHHGGISSSNGGKGAGASTKAKKPNHHVRVLDARTGFEQEMKGLNDSPVKISLKNTPEKKQLRKERGAGALDLHTDHVIPRLCNMVNVKEDSSEQDVSRDLDSSFIAGRNINSKPRLLDSMKPKKIGEAPSGSPIKKPKSTMPDVKWSLEHEETRKRTEELQQLTQTQAKRLEDYCHRVDLSAAQLKEQSRMHEELNLKLEAECGGRLESEAKLMVFCEMMPNVEEKLKSLCDEMLFMEVQLQEQVDLRIRVEAALERERQERMHFVAKLEEQVDLRNKLGENLEQERQERLQLGENLEDLNTQVESLVGQLQEQSSFREELKEKLDQECKERVQHIGRMEDQTKMHAELAQKVEERQDERLKSETSLKEKLKDLQNQVLSLAMQLQEQIELRKELEERLNQEREERKQNAVKMSNHTSESLPVSSIPWSQEKIEFAKFLDEQKTLLANQVKEAEILKNATEKKVGLPNHQVQNLEVPSEIAETVEYVFSAKEQAKRQTMWRVFQVLCLGMGLMSFIVSLTSPVHSFPQPT